MAKKRRAYESHERERAQDERDRKTDARRREDFWALLRESAEPHALVATHPAVDDMELLIAPSERLVSYRVMRLWDLGPATVTELLEKIGGSDKWLAVHLLLWAFVTAEEFYERDGSVSATPSDIPLKSSLIGNLGRSWGLLKGFTDRDAKERLKGLYSQLAWEELSKWRSEPTEEPAELLDWDVDDDEPPWKRFQDPDRRSRADVELQIGRELMRASGIVAEAAGFVTAAVLNHHLELYCEDPEQVREDAESTRKAAGNALKELEALERLRASGKGEDSANSSLKERISKIRPVEQLLDDSHRQYLQTLGAGSDLPAKKYASLKKAIQKLGERAKRTKKATPRTLHSASYIAQRLTKAAKASKT